MASSVQGAWTALQSSGRHSGHARRLKTAGFYRFSCAPRRHNLPVSGQCSSPQPRQGTCHLCRISRRRQQSACQKHHIDELKKIPGACGEFCVYENEVMKKARATRAEIRRNASDYIKELRDSGSPDDIKLAELIAEKMNNLPPPEPAQECQLSRARDRIRRKRLKRTAAGKARAEAIKEAIRRRKKAEQEGEKRYR